MKNLLKIEDKIVSEELIFRIVELAQKAILYEVSSYPTPGLVSPVSNGCHTDMNFYTFIDSTMSLNKYFLKTCIVSLENCDYDVIFNKLRDIGIEAETDMLERTNGVNTHKGMIFIMIVTISAIIINIKKHGKFINIRDEIKNLTKDLSKKDFDKLDEKKKLTYGEKLFIKYNLKGIRGEVEEGLPIIFNVALKTFKESSNLNINDRLVQTLISIMAVNDDTTVLHRKDIDMLYYIKQCCKNILNIGGMNSTSGRLSIDELDKELSVHRISPGGSADLLALTMFLSDVEKIIFN
ncbi:triphosphoribosyl-dephospho-CoA synthase CitG [Clostridium frigidicarnis]|uniref:triphosphoribosyl-dephospho-CoA synthase n=1 Tax=Clostridium frigidicarnis TaxID=84698 RepID=A0A1I0Z4A1_9CLOT|nr:triphosphoribosyl-dephospho-CoA synthase CitG [Clostridium frigidicarnis]SFB20445.1 triphosphoribosyl-dephospho-CoA synthase [Clostridium frigidicarnis]